MGKSIARKNPYWFYTKSCSQPLIWSSKSMGLCVSPPRLLSLVGRCCCSSVKSPKSTGQNQLSSGENSSKTEGKVRRAGSAGDFSRPGRYRACLVLLAWKSAEGDLAATPLIAGASGNILHLYDCLPGSPQTKCKNMFSARK